MLRYTRGARMMRALPRLDLGGTMATRSTIFSDISGDQLDDTTHTRVVVRLPGKNYAQTLDMSTAEAEKLVGATLDLVTFTIFAPNVAPREAIIEAKQIEKIFKGVDFEGVLSTAPRAEAPAERKTRAPRGSAPKSGDKVNYASAEHCGELHRGRITEEESSLVRADPDRASANRERQTGKGIDWNDPKEKSRYGIE